MSNGIGITIAIEAAIKGGSLAVFRGSERLDGIVGAAGISRAEDLLPNIDVLLSRNGLVIFELTDIIVSAGPGSFTGIRIGIATALGLAASTGANLHRVSALAVMALTSQVIGLISCALAVGRDIVCVQTFSVDSGSVIMVSEPRPYLTTEFHDLVASNKDMTFVVSGPLVDDASDRDTTNVQDIGDDLASHFGRYGRSLPDTEPMFIGKQK